MESPVLLGFSLGSGNSENRYLLGLAHRSPRAVAVAGILMSLAVPAVIKAFQSSKSTRFVSDLKKVSNAFEFYAFENEIYPPDARSGVVPDGMSGYLRDFPWTLATCIGGVGLGKQRTAF